MANGLLTFNPTFNEDDPFPSAPAIVNDDIHARVFTPRAINHVNGIFEVHPDDPSQDSEKYKFLGATVLGLIATGLLLDIYPSLHLGSYMKIRALIVGNSTLAAISDRCALPAKLKLPAQEVSPEASPDLQAEVFKSYVGGLYLDQGYTVVEEWLKAVFTPYITKAYIHVRAQHYLPSPPSLVAPQVTTGPISPTSATHTSAPSTGYLAFFNEHLRRKTREGKIHDDYVLEKNFPVWLARVEVDGEILGCGKGGTKKVARNEAAKEALLRMGIPV